MHLTQEQRIFRHKSFLQANWELIASFSWEHFLAEGRGMVVIPEEDFVHLDTPELKPLRFAYAAKDSELMRKVSGHFEAKEWGWLTSYDPDQRVIVIIVREGAGTSGYLMGSKPKPSDAYTRQQAKVN